MIRGVEGNVPQELVTFKTTEYDPGCVNNMLAFWEEASVGATNWYPELVAGVPATGVTVQEYVGSWQGKFNTLEVFVNKIDVPAQIGDWGEFVNVGVGIASIFIVLIFRF